MPSPDAGGGGSLQTRKKERPTGERWGQRGAGKKKIRNPTASPVSLLIREARVLLIGKQNGNRFVHESNLKLMSQSFQLERGEKGVEKGGGRKCRFWVRGGQPRGGSWTWDRKTQRNTALLKKGLLSKFNSSREKEQEPTDQACPSNGKHLKGQVGSQRPCFHLGGGKNTAKHTFAKNIKKLTTMVGSQKHQKKKKKKKKKKTLGQTIPYVVAIGRKKKRTPFAVRGKPQCRKVVGGLPDEIGLRDTKE